MAELVLYVADTSALTFLERFHGRTHMRSLWDKIERLIAERRFLCPRQVLRELEAVQGGTDPLLEWARSQEGLFVPITEFQSVRTSELIADFPTLVDKDKAIPDADPWVVAVACEVVQETTFRPIVLTSELRADIRDPRARSKIPNACDKHGITCGAVYLLWQTEDWRI
jgi:hypothetical protein